MFDRVFLPLGLDGSDLHWRSHAYRPDPINGIDRREFASGIAANVDAMARIGLLYLREGYWEGQQILPPGFVDEVRSPVPGVVGLPVGSNTPWGAEGAADHYGLLWWNNADGSLPGVPSDAFWSYGLFESFIIVIPSLDIVVSRAGSAWTGTRDPSYYLILEPFLQPIVAAVVEEQPVSVPSMSKWGMVFSSVLLLLVGAGLVGGLRLPLPAGARKGPRSG